MIYFIQQGENGPVKIGVSRTEKMAQRRVAQLQTAHSEELRLLGMAEGSYPEERRFHLIFADNRIRGEWFMPSADLMFVAASRPAARELLEQDEAYRRWWTSGLINDDGVLTDAGIEWFTRMELECDAFRRAKGKP